MVISMPVAEKSMVLIKEYTAVLREAWATLPESSSRPLLATLAQSRNLAHASLETAVPVCLVLNNLRVRECECQPCVFCNESDE